MSLCASSAVGNDSPCTLTLTTEPKPEPAPNLDRNLDLNPDPDLALHQSFHAGLFALRGPKDQLAWLMAPDRLPFRLGLGLGLVTLTLTLTLTLTAIVAGLSCIVASL